MSEEPTNQVNIRNEPSSRRFSVEIVAAFAAVAITVVTSVGGGIWWMSAKTSTYDARLAEIDRVILPLENGTLMKTLIEIDVRTTEMNRRIDGISDYLWRGKSYDNQDRKSGK